MGIYRITRSKKSLYISLLIITTALEFIMKVCHYITMINCIIHDSIFCIGCYVFCRKIVAAPPAAAAVPAPAPPATAAPPAAAAPPATTAAPATVTATATAVALY